MAPRQPDVDRTGDRAAAGGDPARSRAGQLRTDRGFLVYVIYAGFWLSWISRARSFQGIPWVSYSLVTLAFPVGAALLLFTTALKALDALRGAPEAGRPDAGAV